MKILNIGACHIDCVYKVGHIVRKGETLSSDELQHFPGGKGLNQSIAMARAGAQVYFAGCIGEDGIFLKELLEESGVNTDYLKILPEKTGHAIIQVDNSGENSIFLYPGTDAKIDDEYVESVLRNFDEGDYLVLQNEINNIPHIIDCAYERGMKIVFNPSPYNEEIKKVDFRKLSWVILNEVEAGEITNNGNASEAFQILKETYPNLDIVITLGKRGCMCTDGNEIKKQRAYEVETVDTTGAGDTFTGYFYAGITEGKSHGESAKQASLASALSVTKQGAAVSIPYIKDVEQMALILLEKPEPVSRKEEMIVMIEKYIEEHIGQVTLQDLAKQLNYSPAYTSRWIRQNMHTSYNELVQKKRCMIAAKLLRETDMMVGEIIEHIGYHNENFFRSKFSSIYGKKPKQFREHYKKIKDN